MQKKKPKPETLTEYSKNKCKSTLHKFKKLRIYESIQIRYTFSNTYYLTLSNHSIFLIGIERQLF